MYIVREIMSCKPGQVRPLVEKFQRMAKLMKKMGYPKPKVMTDISGEPYWTVITEIEVENLDEFFKGMNDPKWEEAGKIMEGYHDLVDSGRREIYRVES